MADCPDRDGDVAGLVRDRDWGATSLGAIQGWPERLRIVVELVLASPMVATVALGDDRLLIYNDAAARLYGERHPAALGRPLAETFANSYPAVAPLYDRVFAGESVTVRSQPLAVGTGDGGEVFDAYLTPVRDEDGGVMGAHMVGFEIGDRARDQAALLESEERQTFLLRLSDALRRLADPSDIQRVAMDMLGRLLGASGAQYYIADETGEYLSSSGGYTDGVPATVGRFRLIEFGRYAYDGFHAGETQVVSDVTTDARISGNVLAAYRQVGFLAYIGVPFVQQGRLLGTIAVHQSSARRWTTNERLIVEQTAERAGIAVEHARAQAAVRDSEARFRRVADNMSQLVWTCDRLGNVNWYNRRWLDFTGLEFEAMRSWGWEKVQHPDHVGRVVAGVKRAAASGEPWEDTFPLRRHDGVYRWFFSQAAPIRDGSGEIIQWFGTNTDVTDRVRAEAALRESEERQAFLLTLSDTLRPLADGGAVEREATRLLGEHLAADRCFLSPVYEDGSGMCVRQEYLRAGASSVLGDYTFAQFGDFVASELHAGRTLAVENVSALTTIGEAERASYVATGIQAYLLVPLVRDGGLAAFLTVNHRTPRRWSDADKAVARQTADRLWAARERARAETALRDSERDLRVLVAELQHRVRNILTVTRLTFARTMEREGGRDELAEHFLGRLDAMSRTQVALTRRPERTANLEDLIRDELLSVAARVDGGAVTLDGPEVELDHKTAENLAMALHELTTNALKYGALSTRGATLAIGWRLHGGEGRAPALDLTWVEKGVPAIDLRPGRRGFGLELIEEALPYRLGAETRIEFRGGGVRCSIRVPLATGGRGDDA